MPVGVDVAPTLTDNYLQHCHDLVCKMLADECRSISTTHWLWLLRRVPDHFFQKRVTSARGAGFNRNLAEIISAVGGARTSRVPPQNGAYPHDPQIIDSLLRLIAGVNLLANIEWLIRSNGRGVRLVFSGGELPVTRETEDDKLAFDRYWSRIEESGSRFLARGGTDFGVEVFNEMVTGALATVGRVSSHFIRTGGAHPAGRETTYRVLKSYHPQLFSLSKMTYLLRDMSGISSWPRPDFWTLLLVLRLAALIFWDFQPPWSQLLQFGYVSIDYDHLVELFDNRWPQAIEDLGKQFPNAAFPRNAESLCRELAAQRPVIRPTRPLPVLRIDHNLAILDVAAGTSALEVGADFTADHGVLANLRASHFERVIQGVIDETGWCPSAKLRKLRGRTLRINGQAITDIDAIACRDGKLLLVSCKSMIYTLEHDLGRYNAVRNLSSTVEAASAAAVKVSEILRRARRGDNFDLSGCSMLDVVVCTPFVVYVRNGAATEPIMPGLPRAVSIRELRRFFQRA